MVLISARESKEMIENIKGKSRSCVGGKSGAEYRICRNMGVCLLVSLFFLSHSSSSWFWFSVFGIHL